MTDAAAHRQQSPTKILKSGVAILDRVLKPSGFKFSLLGSGKGSGGEYAYGNYVRGERRIELHVRHSLGMVTYQIGARKLEHDSYMRFLGGYGSNKYPGFSDDPLQAFRDLAYDIEKFCSDFTRGSGEQFVQFADELERNPKKFKRLPL